MSTGEPLLGTAEGILFHTPHPGHLTVMPPALLTKTTELNYYTCISFPFCMFLLLTRHGKWVTGTQSEGLLFLL